MLSRPQEDVPRVQFGFPPEARLLADSCGLSLIWDLLTRIARKSSRCDGEHGAYRSNVADLDT
jgi:hypothetical protein